MSFWAVNLPPRPDELLSSWLIRNSIANGNDPAGWTGAIWPNWRAWTVDFDRAIPKEKLQTLSKSSGFDIAILSSMTLQPTIELILNRQSINQNKAWHWVIPTGNRNRTRVNGLHFCPECITKTPVYFKKSWRLAWNIACPLHNLLLVNKCQNCNATISPHLVTYQKSDTTKCFSCGHSLSLIKCSHTSSDGLFLQTIMNNALTYNREYALPIGANDCIELFDIVRFFMVFFQNSYKSSQPYKLLHSRLELDGLRNVHESKQATSIESRPVTERHFLMLATSRLLKLTQSEIVDLFLDIGITQQMLMIGKTNSKVIYEINSKLLDMSRRSSSVTELARPIKARSKTEVDASMSEVIRYL